MDYWNNPMLMEKLRRMYSEPSYTSTKPFNPILGEDAPLASEQLMTQPGMILGNGGKSNWLNYAGLGAMTAAPVASALLGKQVPRPDFVSGSSLGSKPIYEAQSVYGQPQQRMPAFLARLLMGAR